MSDIARFDHRRLERERDREFRLIFVVSYPMFLLGAVIGRLLPGPKELPLGPQRRRSVFAEARATAYRTLPYAF